MNVSDAVDLIRKELSLPEYFKKFLNIDELTSAKKHAVHFIWKKLHHLFI